MSGHFTLVPAVMTKPHQVRTRLDARSVSNSFSSCSVELPAGVASTALRAPLVSVIMPTYNRARSVIRSVQSVLSQTFRDFELIVVDDGSFDETPALLSMVRDARLRLVRRMANAGAAAARNTGLARAHGRYMAFIDSDDTWDPRKLEKQLDFMRMGESHRVCRARGSVM